MAEKESRKSRVKKETPIFDMGMISSAHKTRPYAFLKGLVDAGLKISHDKKVFPEEDRIKGKHLKEELASSFEKIKSNINKD